MLYTRLSRLLDDIATARLGSGVGALMRRLARVDLLILDDGMMSELTATQRRDLMEIVDDRHGSIILASQIPLSSWHRAIGDSTYSEAILDRIVHVAYRIELQGDSLRKPACGGTAPSGSAIDQPASHLGETTLK
ncbi:DNA replication protein DnaC [Skermanella aerolata]